MFEKVALDNGLRLMVEPMESVRSVTVGIWIKCGSRYESTDRHGVSHLLEHMLFKGTDTRTAKDIAEQVDSIGGHLNAFTSKEYTCIYLKVIDDHFETALEILSDMYFNSKFSEDELQKERQVIVEELKMYEDTPDEYVHDLLLEACYGQHELAHNILGDRDSIVDLSSEVLTNHHQSHFLPEKTVVSVSGNIEYQRAYNFVDKLFGKFPYQDKGETIVTDIPDYQTGRIVKKKDTEQVHYCLAFPGVPVTSKNLYHLGLLNNILGGSMSSKLFQEIREVNGLCYAVYSYYLNFIDSGLFVIYAGFSPENFSDTNEKIWDIINNVKVGSITQQELQRSKEQVKGNILMGLESTSNRMARLGRDELLKERILTYDEIINLIEQVTVEELTSMAQNIFQKDKSAVSVIGPVSDSEIPV